MRLILPALRHHVPPPEVQKVVSNHTFYFSNLRDPVAQLTASFTYHQEYLPPSKGSKVCTRSWTRRSGTAVPARG
uniref:galactose-3-O-sulfotransferase 2 n=1 Tax=Ictidomys tridecemlineatus TaxID=43179 RepID=UPI001A9D2937|nr:galactose-3-O-sulfotransferase 2 [Ictidomys tridecemlineatus]